MVYGGTAHNKQYAKGRLRIWDIKINILTKLIKYCKNSNLNNWGLYYVF